jgi:hypothetical protein
LRWAAGRDARTHRVHLEMANPPAFRAERAVASYDTGALRPGTIYYWRVDEVTGSGSQSVGAELAPPGDRPAGADARG